MSQTKQTVMVIDDSELAIDRLTPALTAAGYRVIARTSATGCVALMLLERPDVILVDVNLQGISGETLIRCFAAAQPNRSSLVLLHSNLSDEALQTKVTASGADGYICKAHNPATVVREIARALRRSSTSYTSNDMFRGQSGEWQRNAPPAEPPSVAPIESATVALSSQSGSVESARPVVLLVDADIRALSEIRHALQAEPFDLEFALSLAQASRQVTGSAAPEVVVTNVRLGENTGRGLFDLACSTDPSWVRRFVFFATPDDQDAAAELSARVPGRVLGFPINPVEVRRVVKTCLALRAERARAANA